MWRVAMGMQRATVMVMIFNLALCGKLSLSKLNLPHRAAVSQTLAFAGLPSPRSLPTQAPVTCAALPHWRQGAPRLRMTGEGADIRMAKGDADFEGADKSLLSDEGFRDYTRKAPQRLRQHLKESRMDEEGRLKTKKLVIELEQQQVYARSLVYVHIGHLGIGTNNPTSKLHICDTITNTPALTIQNNSTSLPDPLYTTSISSCRVSGHEV